MDQAGNIMIRRDQEGGRIREGQVLFNDRGIDVAVRGDDRKARHEGVQRAGYLPYGGIRGKEPIRMGCYRIRHRLNGPRPRQ